MNFRISDIEQSWPQHSLLQNLGQRVYQTKVQDVDDLRRRLIDVWVGVELSVIDDGIDHWHSRLHACFRATGGHFEYSSWHKLAKTLLTVRNEVKIIYS